MERIIGIEVEYGISSPTEPSANPILTSTQAVLAYAAAAGVPRAKRTRWDYEVESPLRDARGFDLGRFSGPAPVIDADEVGAANMILTNGARLYVDHAHPEYSAPEVRDPLDAVIWDKAGERVMEAAARHASSVPGAPRLQLYKNNVDGKGASYGTHENYLMSRATPFSAVIAGLSPFFASRQVITGSGRVGIGQSGDEAGFQLSQRADYIEVEVGLETTLKRGIINTRDEPHADADKYRRLHCIIGDANLAEMATYLKVGTTALVLDIIEAGVDLSDLQLARPVTAVHQISHDPTLRQTVALTDGREMTALALQRIYLDRVAAVLEGQRRFRMAEDFSNRKLRTTMQFKAIGLAREDSLKIRINDVEVPVDYIIRVYDGNGQNVYEGDTLPPFHLYVIDMNWETTGRKQPLIFGDNQLTIHLVPSAAKAEGTASIEELECYVYVRK